MSNITILLLTTEYRETIIGGLGRHVTDLTAVGAERGLIYIVLTISKTEAESYSFEHGIHVYRLVPWNKNSKDFLEFIRNINFRFIQFVSQELKMPFDLIHAHDWLTGISAIQLKKLNKKPLLTTIHALEHGRKLGRKSVLTTRIENYEQDLIDTSDHIIVCSLSMREEIIKRFEGKGIDVIPNGILPEKYQQVMIPSHAKAHFPFIHLPYLLGMGRFVEEKGFQLLITAFSKIQTHFPSLHLVIAGNGPLFKEMKKLTTELNLDDKVHFPGFVDDIGRNTLLNNCFMLIIPSLYEPFGIISLEGMAVRKPVGAFKIGGLAEILSQDNGILINTSTSDALAATLYDSLSKPNMLMKVANQGYEASHKYDWYNLIDQMIDLYSKMVKKNK